MPDDTIRSADILADRLKNPTTLAAVQASPTVVDGLADDAKRATDTTYEALRRATALENDRVVYRMTTWFLGSAVLVIAIGIILIRLMPVIVGKTDAPLFQIPESLVAIASAAVGALAGLLSPLGTRSS